MDEEAILSALSALMPQVRWTRPGDAVQNTHAFRTTSRRVKLFSDVPSSDWPVCMQAEWGDDTSQVTNLPYKWTLGVNWIVYQNTAKDPKVAGTIENNCILNGIRTVLAPKVTDVGYPDKRNTLGGLVWHCFIHGKVFKDPGDVDAEGMMIIPIKLLVP